MPINPLTQREMAPIESVFSGDKQTPHSVFDRKRRESGWTPERPTGTVASVAPPAIDMALECPSCRLAGREGVRVFAQDQRGYYCIPGEHHWKDFDALMNLNPRKLVYRGKLVHQDGFEKVTCDVPGAVAEAAKKKFGDRLSPTVAAVLDVISGEQYLLLGESDCRRIQERVPEEIRSPSALAGKVIAMAEKEKTDQATIDQLRVQLRSAVASRTGQKAVTESTVVLDLGDDLFARLVQKCQEKGWDANTYIINAITLGIDGDWV